MLSGDEDHKVTAAFIGKGSRCSIRGVDQSYAVKFLEFFPEQAGKKFYVEEESLMQQGIDRSQLAEEFVVVSEGTEPNDAKGRSLPELLIVLPPLGIDLSSIFSGHTHQR